MGMAPSDVLLNKLVRHSELASSDLSRVRDLTCTVRRLASNEDCMKQADCPRASTIVVEGILARYHVLESGRRQYISLHLPGEWPDAQSLFLGQMDHSLCAIGPTVICTILHEELTSLFRDRPAVAFAVWRETLIDGSILREAIVNNSCRAPLARLAHWFCEIYFRAEQLDLVQHGMISLALSQAQIGEMLGMSLVSVNRTLKQLRRFAAAEFRDGVLTVKDWMKLSSIGEFDAAYLHRSLFPRRQSVEPGR